MHLPDHTVVYAIGDIHGCRDLLNQVLEWIDDHVSGLDCSRKLIVVLGDVIDRGPDSRGVIDQLLKGPPTGFELICLRGNHENMMLRALEKGAGISSWFENGGRQTLSSYNMDSLQLSAFSSHSLVRDMLNDAVPASHQQFLTGTHFYHREGDYLFVHAGVRPGIEFESQTPEDMMWIRRQFTDSSADLGFTVVHGHSITPQPSIRSNAIGLDTGAYKTGKLSCAALWGDQQSFFTTP